MKRKNVGGRFGKKASVQQAAIAHKALVAFCKVRSFGEQRQIADLACEMKR